MWMTMPSPNIVSQKYSLLMVISEKINCNSETCQVVITDHISEMRFGLSPASVDIDVPVYLNCKIIDKQEYCDHMVELTPRYDIINLEDPNVL